MISIEVAADEGDILDGFSDAGQYICQEEVLKPDLTKGCDEDVAETLKDIPSSSSVEHMEGIQPNECEYYDTAESSHSDLFIKYEV